MSEKTHTCSFLTDLIHVLTTFLHVYMFLHVLHVDRNNINKIEIGHSWMIL